MTSDKVQALAAITAALMLWPGSARADGASLTFQLRFDDGLSADAGGKAPAPLQASGAELVPGRSGQALRLGKGEKAASVVYAGAGNIDLARGTIAFQVRLDWDFQDSTSRVKRAWFTVLSADGATALYLHSAGSNLIFGVFDDERVVHAVLAPQFAAWKAGEWHEVACTWDLPDKRVAIALDGVLASDAASKAGQGSWRPDASGPGKMVLGSLGSLAAPLAGVIDEFKIYGAVRNFPKAAPAADFDAEELARLRQESAAAINRLESAVRKAQQSGHATAYAEAVATAARTGVWRMQLSNIPLSNADAAAYCRYIIRRCREAEEELAELGRDRRWARQVHRRNTQDLKVVGDGFVNSAGEEVLLVGVRNVEPPEFGEMSRFFNLLAWSSGPPADWLRAARSAGFAGQVHLFWKRRVKPALAQYAELRNVDGWCGHNWSEGLCIDSPRAREIIAGAVDALGVLHLPQPADAAYVVLSAEDEYMCWCAASRADFRRWLEGQYGSLAAVNRAWSADWKSLDAIEPPRLTHSGINPSNRAAWYDWQRFNRARTTAFYAWLKGLVRKRWPTAPVCGGAHMQLADNRWGTKGVDPEGLNKSVNDVIQCETMYFAPTRAPTWSLSDYGMDLYAEALLDFQRSTCAKPAIDLEFHAWLHYAEALRAQGGKLPANYTHTAILRHFLHGIRAANIWVWNRRPGPEEHAAAFGRSPVAPLSAVEELLRAGLDVQRLTPEIVALSRAPRQVAILVSDAAFMQIHPTFARSHRPSPLVTELRNTLQASMFLDTPIGYVTERAIAQGALASYRVILVPAISHLDDATLARLLEFVESGGNLVVTPRSFLFDEYHRPRSSLKHFPRITGMTFVGRAAEPDAADRADPAFAELQSIDPADPRVPTVQLNVDPALTARLGAEPLTGTGVRLAIEPNEARVVARFADDGAPALLRIDAAAGRIWWSAIPLSTLSYARLLECVLQDAQIERLIRVRDQAGERLWGVEARSCRAGDDVLVYLINLRSDAVTCTLSAERQIQGVHDLIANQPGHARMRLAALETALLRLKLAP